MPRRGPLLLLVLSGCGSSVAVEDPQAVLADPQAGSRRHLVAIQALSDQAADPGSADPSAPAAVSCLAALHEVLWEPGYALAVREEAFLRLEALDEAGLKRAVRTGLPSLRNRAWQERLFQMIADRGWTDLSPAIVSAWARPIPNVEDLQRTEHEALARLVGEDRVIDVVFELFVSGGESPFLPERCWDLLIRLGQHDRLRRLLADTRVGPDDALLADLRAGVVDLGVFPRTHEEILWLRKLREPARSEFYSSAAAVVAGLSEERRRELELRDLPILVAASVHEPALLDRSREDLYESVRSHVRDAREHVDTDRFRGQPGSYGQRLHENRERLTWGDLAAMLLAVRAAGVEAVAAHLFDYAERDRADRGCEYGGTIGLDSRGRFEVLEFPPRLRRNDQEFVASQEMLDAAYTAVFHFHLHAQRHRNAAHAGPGVGDLRYAQVMRSNCLVFTFIDERTLNVDFYRHGHVIVDLGEVTRPQAGPGSDAGEETRWFSASGLSPPRPLVENRETPAARTAGRMPGD